MVAVIATISSLCLEGRNRLIPIPPDQYSVTWLSNVTTTALAENGTDSTLGYSFYQYHGGIELFCLEDHCVFGWMSSEWAVKILIFGLWIGVFCIAGFNYAVSSLPSFRNKLLHDLIFHQCSRCNTSLH